MGKTKTSTPGNTPKAQHLVHKVRDSEQTDFQKHLRKSAKLDTLIDLMVATVRLRRVSLDHEEAVTPRPRNADLGMCPRRYDTVPDPRPCMARAEDTAVWDGVVETTYAGTPLTTEEMNAWARAPVRGDTALCAREVMEHNNLTPVRGSAAGEGMVECPTCGSLHFGGSRVCQVCGAPL
jgi:hypothetical protein